MAVLANIIVDCGRTKSDVWMNEGSGRASLKMSRTSEGQL